MDAEPEPHPLVLGQRRVAGLQRPLDLHRALDRADRAGEAGEEVVAGEVHQVALVTRDDPLDLLAIGGHEAYGRRLVAADQP